ncbi:hypothetical protein TNCT_515771 [Trichonephila clavata]|uniref:Uncharacterized protein n=1 Tax=Trichonephila clavata TaxID=2740835 RepID=A0A8X6IBU8_TRICU|nr:hypothetical protein TNCT_515771 [Trichonephila clavata]
MTDRINPAENRTEAKGLVIPVLISQLTVSFMAQIDCVLKKWGVVPLKTELSVTLSGYVVRKLKESYQSKIMMPNAVALSRR